MVAAASDPGVRAAEGEVSMDFVAGMVFMGLIIGVFYWWFQRRGGR